MMIRARYVVAKRIVGAAMRHPAAIASVAALFFSLHLASLLRFRDGDRGMIATLIGAMLLHAAVFRRGVRGDGDRAFLWPILSVGLLMRFATFATVTPGDFSDLIPRLLDDGRSLAHGFDPRIFAPLDPCLDAITDRSSSIATVDATERSRPILTPPILLAVAAAFGRTSGAEILWRTFVALAEIAFLTTSLWRRHSIDDERPRWRALFLATHPLWIVAFWGAARPEILAILAASFAVERSARGHERSAAVFAVIGVATAPIAIFPLIAAVWRRPTAAKRTIVALVLATFVVGVVPIDLRTTKPVFENVPADLHHSVDRRPCDFTLDELGDFSIAADGVDWRGVARIDGSGRIDAALNRLTSAAEGAVSTDRRTLVLSSRSLDATMCVIPDERPNAARSIAGRYILFGTPPSAQPKLHGLVWEFDGRGETISGDAVVSLSRAPSGRLRLLSRDGPILGEGELCADGALIDMRRERGGFVLARLRPSTVSNALHTIDRGVPDESPLRHAASALLGVPSRLAALVAIFATLALVAAIGASARVLQFDAGSAAAHAMFAALAAVAPASPFSIVVGAPLFLATRHKPGLLHLFLVGIFSGFGGGLPGWGTSLFLLASTAIVVILPAVDFRALLRRPRPTT